MKSLIFSLLLLFAAAVDAEDQDAAENQGNQGSQGKVYTWVDKNGVTHYSRSAEEAAEKAQIEKVELEEVDSLSVIPSEVAPTEQAEDTAGEN